MSKRWIHVLLAALAVDVALAILVRAHELQRFARGDRDSESLLAVVSFAWLIVVVVTAAGVGRSLYAARRTLHRQSQAIAADASLSRDWLWEADTKHRLTYSSSGVTDLLGYAAGDLLGVCMLDLIATDQREPAERLMRHSLATRTGWEGVEHTWLHADGSTVVLQGTAAPMLDEKGAVVGFRGTRRLVTPAMAGERALTAAKQRVSDVLDSRAVEVALQPIIDVGTGRLAGVEALARFHDGRGPDVWFRDARDTGQGLELDRLTFTAALDLLPSLPDSCYLSINASPELLTDPILLQVLCSTDLPLDRVVVEITEHVAITSYPDLHAGLTPLRERGVRLAIDDTGAGYASLSHVLQLRPDIIKLDRSLIAEITEDPARRSLVTALVLLALDLNAAVTGEGVETAAELDTLATLGVDCVQGYFLARPTTDPTRWARWTGRDWARSVRAKKDAALEAAALEAGTLNLTR